MLMTYLLKADVLNLFYAIGFFFFWQIGEAYRPLLRIEFSCIKLNVKDCKKNLIY